MTNSLFKNAVKSSVGNSFETLYTAPVGKASYLIQLDVASVGSTGIQITVRIHDSSEAETVNLVKSAPIPLGAALQIIDGQKIVLEAGDYIEIKCDTVGETVDAILSLVEDVNS